MKTDLLRSPSGFSLVEVTLALGISAFTLVVIFGLLVVGVKSNQDTVTQTEAASLARVLSADLRCAVKNTLSLSPVYNVPIPAVATASANNTVFLRQDGSLTDSNPANGAQYRATINFGISSDSTARRNSTTARILITWPALADKVAANFPVNYSGSYDALTILGRN